MSILRQLRERAKSLSGHAAPPRILLPEHHDPRVIEAANALHAQGLVEVLCIEAHPDLSKEIEVFATREDALDWRQRAAASFQQARAAKGIDLAAAEKAIENPLLLATLLIKLGYADGGVAGSVATTADVLRAGIQGLGLAEGANLVSSFFLMEMPDQRLFSYADCGVNPNPNAEQLAQIAIATARNHQELSGETPRVAMLSFSTKGSAEHESVQKMRDALALVKAQAPNILIDGELQFDAAIMPAVAKSKAPDSAVAGYANVFIFPDLNSGNITYKATERLAGATAIGPLLQGLAKPWMDLSRGCKSSDIVDTAVIAANLSR